MKIIFFLLSVIPQFLLANVKVNPLFSNHMVVQRETKIPIWGWAESGEKITVTGSWGKIAKTVTDINGNWRVNLKTPKAGGPYVITISGENTITINDVLSGEVWLCTGQSNMDFALSKFTKKARESQYQPLVEFIKKELATANDDELRHIEVLQNTSLYTKQSDFKGQWISAIPNQVDKITATGYFFAKELRKKLKVPVGLVECSWGGTRVQPWLSEDAYLKDENLREYFLANRKKEEKTIAIMDAIGYVDTLYQAKLAVWESKNEKGRKPKPQKHPKKDMQAPTTLYNGMLRSIIPYAIKGAIWYQGESNAVYMPNEYKFFFTAMIEGWRKDWSQGDFPFYWTQLASYKRANNEADKGWVTVDNQLRKTLELSNTGMAVLHDIGEAKDIHPHNKMDVGKRLALWALDKDYNIKVPAVSGPLYKSFKVIKNKIQVKFTEVGTGLMVGHKKLMEPTIALEKPLKWFEIMDENGVWKKANAKIIAKNRIEVWNKEVEKPLHVRYAWSSIPEGANLYNKEGLPTAIFSTEND